MLANKSKFFRQKTNSLNFKFYSDQLGSTLTPMRAWTHFIRFLDNNGKIQWGEPVDAKYQNAKLIIDGVVSDKVVGITSILSPVANPSNIICIGLNYNDHASETGIEPPKYPIVFYKNTSSMNSHGRNIVIPKLAQRKVDYEAELAVIIGKECKNVRREDALSYVLGYTCANDVTARIWQENSRCGTQWSFSKSFDTFCPLGPVIVSPTIITNPNELTITCTLNSEVVQSSNTRDMIFDVQSLISFLSQDTTLLAGTVILTGTPSGVGFTRSPPIYLKEGDVVTVEIDKIGKLRNTVIEDIETRK